mgnify:CR=1 FL=1
MTSEIIHKQVNENADSIEIGTPGKEGCIKCYGDFNKDDEFKKKIDKAIELRKYLNAQVKIIN